VRLWQIAEVLAPLYECFDDHELPDDFVGMVVAGLKRLPGLGLSAS